MKKSKLFSVIYRTGGTLNFKWNRLPPGSHDKAQDDLLEMERMGYKSLLVNHEQSLAIGLPETYE